MISVEPFLYIPLWSKEKAVWMSSISFQVTDLLIMEGTEKSESSHYSLSYWDRLPNHHVAMEKVAE